QTTVYNSAPVLHNMSLISSDGKCSVVPFSFSLSLKHHLPPSPKLPKQTTCHKSGFNLR
ncbi:hypothetical protein BDP27DRAFT_1332694, partial [Rhodocollybia butyracea]